MESTITLVFGRKESRSPCNEMFTCQGHIEFRLIASMSVWRESRHGPLRAKATPGDHFEHSEIVNPSFGHLLLIV